MSSCHLTVFFSLAYLFFFCVSSVDVLLDLSFAFFPSIFSSNSSKEFELQDLPKRVCHLNWNYLTWTLSTIVDNILILNCLVFSGLIMLVGLRKSLLNVTIFYAKFQFQFDSLHSYLSFSSVCFIHVYMLPFTCMVNEDVYIWSVHSDTGSWERVRMWKMKKSAKKGNQRGRWIKGIVWVYLYIPYRPVSYTHLTLPTNREV